jgi:hypothetical protein
MEEWHMEKTLIVICILVLLPGLAMGQEPDHKTAGRGYGFVAPGIAIGDGSTMGFLHFGGGGEANLYKGIGLGAEIGYLAPIHYVGQGVGMLSIDGLYSFEKSGSKIAPFVTGGYSLLFRCGHLNAMNFGGGVDYWFGKRSGMRFEFRDHVSPRYFSEHLLQGRVGIVFR